MSSRSFITNKEETVFMCPYDGCGRNFVSSEQLKAHIERRHKIEVKADKDTIGSKKPDALKKTQGFDTQKRQSNKLGGLKKKTQAEQSTLSFSTDQQSTPVHPKSKVPA